MAPSPSIYDIPYYYQWDLPIHYIYKSFIKCFLFCFGGVVVIAIAANSIMEV